MACFDLPIDQLQDCGRPSSGRTTVETFWSATLDVELSRPLEPRIVGLETPLRTAHPADETQAFITLSYVDGVNLGAYATVPALFSTAGMDQICPPSTVYAAYRAWGHEDKAITYYPWNGHEGGSDHHTWHTLQWLAERFG
jgi:cephalosporin-C deacetylase-like acetyl esterase